jgi:hypothetical protein
VVVSDADRRRQIREAIRYLKTLRLIVERGAAGHARWTPFIAKTASMLRMAPNSLGPSESTTAAHLARVFSTLHGSLGQLTPPPHCDHLHNAAGGWLEALDLLAAAVLPAIEGKSVPELEAIVRAASEPQIKLRSFQRVHAKTMAHLGRMYRARPKPTKRIGRPRADLAPARRRGS